jgi:hypothetical protein
LLRLFLQHADVGHHLHLAARLRRGRAGEHAQQQPKTHDPRPKTLTHTTILPLVIVNFTWP